MTQGGWGGEKISTSPEDGDQIHDSTRREDRPPATPFPTISPCLKEGRSFCLLFQAALLEREGDLGYFLGNVRDFSKAYLND